MKKILIVYGSKYGCARQCAQQLQSQIKAEITQIDLTKWKKGKTSVICDSENRLYDGISKIDVAKYDVIIVGGSFYVGKWQVGVSDFLATHHDSLQNKKHAFYFCHMQKGNELEQEIEQNIPESLLKSAIAIGRFGGVFDETQMNLFEKLIVKQIAKAKKEPFTTDNLDPSAIKQFAWEIQRALSQDGK